MILGPLQGCQHIRPMRRDDMQRLRQWSNDPEMRRLAGEKFSGDTTDWWNRMVRDRHRTAFAIITEEDLLIGDIELEHITWRAKEAEIRIAIDPSQWNRGYGTRALLEALEVAFTRLRLESVYLRVANDNIRAIRVYQKAGFRKAGILPASGRLAGGIDLILMAIHVRRYYRFKESALSAAAVSTA